jgi:acyl-CoA synthetase (AMP-forming)/AMP-acid ligase II
MSAVQIPSSIANVLDRALQLDPEHEALVGRSGRLSYAALDRRCNQAARAFAALGIQPGDRVAVSLPNDLDIVTAFHGAMRLGAIWVGVNRALAPPEIAYILHDTASSLAILEAAAADALHDGERIRALDRVVVGGLEGARDEWSSPLTVKSPRRSGSPSTRSRPRRSRTRAGRPVDQRASCTANTICSRRAPRSWRAGGTDPTSARATVSR